MKISEGSNWRSSRSWMRPLCWRLSRSTGCPLVSWVCCAGLVNREGACPRFSCLSRYGRKLAKDVFPISPGVHDGTPVYEQERFSLIPSSRELQLAWHVMAPLAGGQMMLEVAHAMNAGHQPGQERSRIGLGWWLTW